MWARLSWHSHRKNVVWLQLHAISYILGNFMRTLVFPDAA